MKVKLITLLLVLSGMSAFGQGKFGATPDDSVKCVTQLSLYIEFYKQKNYADAVGPWREALATCPKSRKSLYINGVKMLKSFIKEEKGAEDQTKREALVDELFKLYESRIEHFGQEGYVKGRWGSDMLKYRKDNRKEAYDMLDQSFKLQGDKSEAGVLVYYFRAKYLMVRKKESEVNELLEIYDPVMKVIQMNLEKYKDEEKKRGNWEKVRDNINDMLSKVAGCEDLIPLFQKEFEQNSEDPEKLKKYLKLMDKQKCDDDPFYLTVAKKLNELEPSAQASYSIGAADAKNSNCKDAITSFEKAFNLAEDEELKAKAAMQAAKCSYNMRSFSNVRAWALKALSVNPNMGEAYIIIGDAYSATGKKCGEDDCTNRAAYWAAYDKYAKAKAVDASVATKANQKMANVKGQFPKKEDCFFVSKNAGDSYTISGCWISETTTIRIKE